MRKVEEVDIKTPEKEGVSRGCSLGLLPPLGERGSPPQKESVHSEKKISIKSLIRPDIFTHFGNSLILPGEPAVDERGSAEKSAISIPLPFYHFLIN